MLLEFTKPKLRGGGAVFIDSDEIASVEDVNAGPHEVCQVTTRNGETHMVDGKSPLIVDRIRHAQAEALAGIEEADADGQT